MTAASGRATRPPRALVLDLDGVVRHFHDTEAEISRRHGLEPGSVIAAAVEEDLLDAVVTGAITKRQWLARAGARLGVPEALEAWGATPADLDRAVLDLVALVRAGGCAVHLFTNGTDEVPAELDALGVTVHFDRVFNTADLGVRKPDPASYRRVCAELALAPQVVAFTDDRRENVEAARRLGLPAHHFTGADRLGAWLAGLGLLPRDA